MQVDWKMIKENVLLNCTNAYSASSLAISEKHSLSSKTL